MDPLSAADYSNGRPSSWIGFDEISMSSPPIGGHSASGEGDRNHLPVRPGSADLYDGRSSVAREEQLQLDDAERPVITPLPTKEIIAGKYINIFELDEVLRNRVTCD